MNHEQVEQSFLTELAQKFPHAWSEFVNYNVEKQNEYDDSWPFFYDKEDKQYYISTFAVLPYPFQLGLFISFIVDRGGCSWEIDDMYEFDLKEEMYGFFVMINDQAG